MKIDWQKGFWNVFTLLMVVVIFWVFQKKNADKNFQLIEQKNKFLKQQNDSLNQQLQNNQKKINKIDSVIVQLNNQKVQIVYRYEQQNKKIDYLPSNELVKLFDSIFAKNNLN